MVALAVVIVVVVVVVALVVAVVALVVVIVKSASGACGRKFGPVGFGLAAVALWPGPWSDLSVQIHTYLCTYSRIYLC